MRAKKSGGIDPTERHRLRQLKDANKQLQQLATGLTSHKIMLKQRPTFRALTVVDKRRPSTS